ncbi:hypothetical protein [Candidatus Nanohalovita haloferacivicina]|uniref:hypothetical protein n=1 Tax=Candidatus Nanohalovita haloferacivicina TaxID=2978046 RepID=UPI00325F99F4|nr:hypothetical protein HBNXNv_0509 [Candidatus Nanohalobia archaeon BNXNv]
MGQSSGVEKFAAAFIQIHIASALISIIVQRTSGTLHSLATYLISLHVLAAAVYLMNIQSTRVLKEIVVKAYTGIKTGIL